jgi:hypothetical protein
MSLYKDASLVMIPSAYKDGKLYSIRPTDGSGDFTFSRGSNLAATRVDVNGLIEKGRENVLLQSNQFDTSWAVINTGVVTSGQSGYDGSNDAWLLSTSQGSSGYVYQNISASNVLSFSFYAKAGSLDWTYILVNGSSTYAATSFNLSSGTFGTNFGGGFVARNSESVGNGWYRITLTTKDGSSRVRIYPAYGNAATGNAGNIYIQDAQLEQGLVATDYIETTTTSVSAGILEDMPRLDYSGGASCPSLLLEPQRTNLIPQSEYFGAWGAASAGTGSNPIITSNYATSPDGNLNATRIQFNRGSGTTSGDTSYITYGLSAGTIDATLSVYLKTNDGSTKDVTLRLGAAIFDYNISVTPEWKRFTLSGSTSVDRMQILLYGNQNSQTADLSCFGAQVEAGSYPTSYIPTYGTSQTRSTERQIGIASLPADIADTSLAHTGFIEIKANEIASGGFQVFGFDDGSYSNYIKLYASNTQKSFRLLALASGSGSASTGFSPDGGYSKFAWSYDGAGIVKIFINGSLITTASITFPTMSAFGFGERSYSTNYTSVSTKQVLLFPTALTDSECIALTTL